MAFDPYERYGDDQLIHEAKRYRGLSHDAPKALDNPSDAWSRHSAEYFRLCEEMKRRGLAPLKD